MRFSFAFAIFFFLSAKFYVFNNCVQVAWEMYGRCGSNGNALFGYSIRKAK